MVLEVRRSGYHIGPVVDGTFPLQERERKRWPVRMGRMVDMVLGDLLVRPCCFDPPAEGTIRLQGIAWKHWPVRIANMVDMVPGFLLQPCCVDPAAEGTIPGIEDHLEDTVRGTWSRGFIEIGKYGTLRHLAVLATLYMFLNRILVPTATNALLATHALDTDSHEANCSLRPPSECAGRTSHITPRRH